MKAAIDCIALLILTFFLAFRCKNASQSLTAHNRFTQILRKSDFRQYSLRGFSVNRNLGRADSKISPSRVSVSENMTIPDQPCSWRPSQPCPSPPSWCSRHSCLSALPFPPHPRPSSKWKSRCSWSSTVIAARTSSIRGFWINLCRSSD